MWPRLMAKAPLCSYFTVLLHWLIYCQSESYLKKKKKKIQLRSWIWNTFILLGKFPLPPSHPLFGLLVRREREREREREKGGVGLYILFMSFTIIPICNYVLCIEIPLVRHIWNSSVKILFKCKSFLTIRSLVILVCSWLLYVHVKWSFFPSFFHRGKYYA